MHSFSSRTLDAWAPRPEAEPLYPYLWKRGDECVYSPTPTDLWVSAPDMLHSCVLPEEVGMPAGKDEAGQCPQAQDSWLRVRVEELLFPGDETAFPESKWIYVVRAADRKPVLEAQAMKWTDDAPGGTGEQRDIWHVVLDPDPSKEPDERDEGSGLTPPVAQLAGDVYRFFISPIRLSARAFRFVLDNLEDVGVEEDLSEEILDATVAAPDPFAWAEDAYDRFFVPALQDRDDFRCDEDMQSASYLHEVFAAWKDVKSEAGEPDALDIAEYLDQSEMDRFRSEFDQHGKDLDFEADRAGAYLAAWLHSPSHRAVEMAGQDDPGWGLDRTAATWGYCARDLQRTEPTRRFADTIVRDKERFIWTHVFRGCEGGDNPWESASGPGARTGISTGPKRDSKFWTGQLNAVSSILTGFIPSFLKYRPAMDLNDAKRIARGLEEDVGKTLYWLGMLEEQGWRDVRKSIISIEGRGTPRIDRYWWGRETGSGRVHAKAFLTEDYLAARAELDAVEADRLKMMRQIEAVEGSRYSRAMKWFSAGKTFADVPLSMWVLYVDAAAFCKAIDYHQKLSADKVAGLVKGLMEVVGTIAAVMEFAAQKQMVASVTASSLAKVGASLAIAANIIEVCSKTGESIDEWKRADWAAMVGKGLGVMAAVTGVAAGIVIYATAAGSIAPGVGTVVGLILGGIAAGLAIAGAWIYTAFKKSEYQQVVRSSCFSSEDWNIELSWAPHKQMARAKKPQRQATNVNALLAQFTVRVEGSGHPNREPESTLVVQSGMIGPGDVIEVVLWQAYKTVDNILSWDDYTRYEAYVRAHVGTERIDHPKYGAFLAHQMVMRDSSFRRDPDTRQLSLRVGLRPISVLQRKKGESDPEAILPENMEFWKSAVDASEALVRVRRDASGNHDIPVGSCVWLRLSTIDLSGDALSSMSTGDHHTESISDGSPAPPPTISATAR